MLLAEIESVMVLVMAGIFLVFAASFVVAVAKVLSAWLQAFMAGVPISVIQIVGMRPREVDVRAVVGSLIMATPAGVPVPSIGENRDGAQIASHHFSHKARFSSCRLPPAGPPRGILWASMSASRAIAKAIIS